MVRERDIGIVSLPNAEATPRPVRLIFRAHPEWGDSRYFTVTLAAIKRLSELLADIRTMLL